MVPPGFKHLPQPSELYFRFAPGVNKMHAMARLRATKLSSGNAFGDDQNDPSS
jgi:hypothetical protein